MSSNGHIHVCARCSAEFNSPTAYPPPGWLWRGSQLYCDACAGLVADPIDDAQPPFAPDDPDDLPAAVIMVASGALMNLTCPNAEDIDIEDIAQALSRICRFAGMTRDFYSVAEHSVHISRRVPPEVALAALLHDASEAYLGDLTRPLKAVLPDYKRIERRVERAVEEAFGVDLHLDCIKAQDIDMAIIEAHRLMPADKWYWGSAPDQPRQRIECWHPDEARRRFLERFHELTAPADRKEAA